MYNESDREKFLNNILTNVKNSKVLIGTYLLGSTSIDFRDIYSDCDFMMAYDKRYNPQDAREEILSFFNKEDIGYIMERKWSDTIWGVSLYMKNGLSTDISFGPLEELKISSNQIKVGVDNEEQLKKHLNNDKNKKKPKEVNIENDGWSFMYLMRKIKIALYRENNIYAYQLLNDARMKVMNLEGISENKKMHEFKAYNELKEEFLNKIYETLPSSISSNEIKKCSEKLIEIFNELPYKWEENLKYLLKI